MNRLFIVTRADLEPGAQCAQAVHGLQAFEDTHPERYQAWKAAEKNVVVLAARDEAHLADLARRARQLNIAEAEWYEPDFKNAMTAVAFAEEAYRILSSLPLALRVKRAA